MTDYLQKILPSKLRLDSMYVQRRTILSDFDVILLTIVHILPMYRKRKVHESNLYHGPLRKLMNRHLAWFGADSVIAVLVLAFTGLIWRLAEPLHIGVLNAFLTALLIALVFSVLNLLLGLHKISWSSAGGILTVDLAFSTFIATLVVVVFNQLKWLPGQLPLPLLIMAGLLSFLGFIAVRYRQRISKGLTSRFLKPTGMLGGQILKERVLIIGAGELGGIASWLINHGDFSRAFTVAGFLDDDPAKVGMVMDGSAVLGMTSELQSIIAEKDIALVVFAITEITEARRKAILKQCEKTGINYFIFPQIFDWMISSLNKQKPEHINSVVCLQKVEEYLAAGNAELAFQEIQNYKELL
jgi:FlaA1/EpsC-like NDP-sugar epimerase